MPPAGRSCTLRWDWYRVSAQATGHPWPQPTGAQPKVPPRTLSRAWPELVAGRPAEALELVSRLRPGHPVSRGLGQSAPNPNNCLAPPPASPLPLPGQSLVPAGSKPGKAENTLSPGGAANARPCAASEHPPDQSRDQSCRAGENGMDHGWDGVKRRRDRPRVGTFRRHVDFQAIHQLPTSANPSTLAPEPPPHAGLLTC